MGRPPKYKTSKEMQIAIDEYFASCVPEIQVIDDENSPTGKTAITDSKGRPVFKMNPPTITGLALHLGFESRQSMYDYEKRSDEFSYTIKKARTMCENYAEEMMLSGEPAAGFIFALKNYGWSDKQEVEHSGSQVIYLDSQDENL